MSFLSIDFSNGSTLLFKKGHIQHDLLDTLDGEVCNNSFDDALTSHSEYATLEAKPAIENNESDTHDTDPGKNLT